MKLVDITTHSNGWTPAPLPMLDSAVLGLADLECQHGRLPTDRVPCESCHAAEFARRQAEEQRQ